jgi:hypothetical protein
MITDVIERIHFIQSALIEKKIELKEARLHAQLLKAETEAVKARLEHARLTNRLEQGSPKLPRMAIE